MVQDIFMADRFPMSDDEEEEEEEFDSKEEDETLRGSHNELSDCSRTRGASQRSVGNDRELATVGLDGFASRVSARTKVEEDNVNSHCSQSPSIPGDGAVSSISPMDLDNDKPHGVDISTRSATGSRNKQPMSFPLRPFELPCGVSLPPEEYYSLLYGNNHWLVSDCTASLFRRSFIPINV